MLTPLQENFQAGTRQFVQGMLLPTTNTQLREWILADMSAALPSVGLSAMDEYMSQYVTGRAANIFDDLHIPVMIINGDVWPIDADANRRHMFSFEAIVIKGADHFLMMDRSDEFNTALNQTIMILGGEGVNQ